MTKTAWLASFVLFSLTASANPPEEQTAVQKAVQQDLLKPLAKKENERSKFSRARPAPKDRRVRVLQQGQDARGLAFTAFAVDSRWGFDQDAEWENDDIVGCRYDGDGAIYVKLGDEYRASSLLLGKKAKQKVPDGVCTPAGTKVAQKG